MWRKTTLKDLQPRVPDLHVHADLGAGGSEAVGPRVIELGLVIGCHLEELLVGSRVHRFDTKSCIPVPALPESEPEPVGAGVFGWCRFFRTAPDLDFI